MKIPEEIKKGLKRCKDCQSCTEYGEPKCPYNDVCECVGTLLDDALAYIQQLEAERDALMVFVKGQCHACKFSDYSFTEEPCDSCFADRRSMWEWRGVQKEETK